MSSLRDLTGLVPVGVRRTPDGPRLQWRIADELVETDFARFRPVRLFEAPSAGKLRAIWQDLADLRMTEPFFKGTRDKAKVLPGCAEPFATDWEVVGDVSAQPGNIPLSGAIFHMARSGSTLVHRLLNATGTVLSLSEVGLMEQALSMTTDWPEDRRNPVLRDAVGVFGQPRRPGERHFVIKMTDGIPNTRLLQFRAAFPSVPWIFIYRDPVEVMVSMLEQPTGNLGNWRRNRARAARILRMPGLADPTIRPVDYLARTLRRYCTMAVRAAQITPPGLFLAVDYKRLPDAVWNTIAPHFGITLSAADREAMQNEARYSAKQTDRQDFRPDSKLKQESATPRVRALAERLVVPVIDQLRALPQG